MPKPTKPALVGAFLAIYLIWGSTYLAIRFGLESLPPMLMAGIRFFLAGGLVYGWMRLRGARRPRPIHWGSALLVGGLLMFGGNGMVTIAQQMVPSGLAALMIATVPLWMTLFDALFLRRSRLSAWVLGGIASGLAGVALLVFGNGAETAIHPLGAALLLVAALSWATGSLCSRSVAFPDSLLLSVAMQMMAGGAILIATGTAMGEWAVLDLSAVTLRSASAFVYLVIFGSIVAFSCYVWLLRVTTASAVSTYAFVNPVVALFLGWSLGDEALDGRILLAALLIVGAVTLIQWRSRALVKGHDGQEEQPTILARPESSEPEASGMDSCPTKAPLPGTAES